MPPARKSLDRSCRDATNRTDRTGESESRKILDFVAPGQYARHQRDCLVASGRYFEVPNGRFPLPSISNSKARRHCASSILLGIPSLWVGFTLLPDPASSARS